MNSNAISKYFDELNNTKSTVKQETTHMKDLKKVETYQKGALKYEKLFNKLEKAYTDCITNCSCATFNQSAQLLIHVTYSGICNVTSDYFITAFKGSMYYCLKYDIYSSNILHKNDVLKGITDNKDKENLNKLYNTLYSFLEFISNNEIIKYTMFFSSNSQFEPSLKNLLLCLPNISVTLSTHNQTFISSLNGAIRYILFGNKAHALYCDEIFKFDVELFTKYLQIPVPDKFKNDFNNMINIMSNEIIQRCKKISKPDPTIYYNIYQLLTTDPNHIFKLNFNNNCISISECSNILESDKIEPFRPISITDSNVLSRVVNGYNPETLYKCLLSIAQDSSDFTQIDNISKALATTLISSISKRQIVVVSCNNNNIVQAKEFFHRLICSEEYRNISVVDNDYDIKQLNYKNFRNILDKISYTKTRALFVNNSEDNVADVTKEKLLKTSNETNVQIFVFQTSRNVDYIPADKLIHINLSDWELKNDISCIVSDDLLWSRLYLSVYGLHLIFNERNNKNKFGIKDVSVENDVMFEGMDQDEIIKKISDEFITSCFVSKEEAEIRKGERRKYINNIKEENINWSSELIKNRLEQQPLFSTYESDFLEYADIYLATQYYKNEINKYNITSKTIKKYVKDNYKETFPYITLNLLYTKYPNRQQGFSMLSIKSPWKEIEKQLKETNVNNPIGIDKQIELQLNNLIEALPNTIDFRHLSIYSHDTPHIQKTNGDSDKDS